MPAGQPSESLALGVLDRLDRITQDVGSSPRALETQLALLVLDVCELLFPQRQYHRMGTKALYLQRMAAWTCPRLRAF